MPIASEKYWEKTVEQGTDLDVAHVTIAKLTGAIGTTVLPIVMSMIKPEPKNASISEQPPAVLSPHAAHRRREWFWCQPRPHRHAKVPVG
jgi:hypothetical protein